MIKVYIYRGPEEVTAEELDERLGLVSAERREKSLRYKFMIDRVLSVEAYLLLKQGLLEVYGIDELPQFGYVEHDKPVLLNHPEIHFNMSHCRRGVICAIGDEPVGADVEEIEPKLNMDLCRYCFSDEEIADITSAENPCMQFTRWWTMKEAYLKLTGQGLTANLPSLFTPGIMAAHTFETHELPDEGFVYTICTKKEG